jgi:alkane 1-monooxygenase
MKTSSLSENPQANKNIGTEVTNKKPPLGASWMRDILPFYLGPSIFALQIYLYFVVGYRNLMFFTWIGYVLIPLLDFALPVDHANLTKEQAQVFQKDKRFLIPLYTVWSLDIVVYCYTMWYLSTGEIGVSMKDFLAFTIFASQAGMVNIVVGHELVHKRGRIHKVLGSVPYFKAMYSHFYLLHVYIHHKKVATPEDPQSARFGESVFSYFARAIPQGLIETYKFEEERL